MVGDHIGRDKCIRLFRKAFRTFRTLHRETLSLCDIERIFKLGEQKQNKTPTLQTKNFLRL